MTTIFEDTKEFLQKFELITGNETPHITEHMQIRINHLQEELNETIKAYESGDLIEIVDGLIDLMYIASGTLNMCGINPQWHWTEVQRVNMLKERGISEKRKHGFDVIKPEGWTGPDHEKIMKWYKK